jgi:hypothetical protein
MEFRPTFRAIDFLNYWTSEATLEPGNSCSPPTKLSFQAEDWTSIHPPKLLPDSLQRKIKAPTFPQVGANVIAS